MTHHAGSVPITLISMQPAAVLERLPSAYQVVRQVRLRRAPSLWEQWCSRPWKAMSRQELDGLLTVARVERLPVVLDSRGMSALLLARVLVEIDRLVASRPYLPQPGMVGVIGDDLAAQRLLALCSYVQVIVPATTLWRTAGVRQVTQVAHQAPRRRGVAPDGSNPLTQLPLPRAFLPVFAALPGATDVDQVSERSGYSCVHVYQILAAARRALGLSASRPKQYDLDRLAHELADALGRADRFEHPPRPSRPSPRMSPIAAVAQRMNEVYR